MKRLHKKIKNILGCFDILTPIIFLLPLLAVFNYIVKEITSIDTMLKFGVFFGYILNSYSHYIKELDR
jgi:hypothetical protein